MFTTATKLSNGSQLITARAVFKIKNLKRDHLNSKHDVMMLIQTYITYASYYYYACNEAEVLGICPSWSFSPS